MASLATRLCFQLPTSNLLISWFSFFVVHIHTLTPTTRTRFYCVAHITNRTCRRWTPNSLSAEHDQFGQCPRDHGKIRERPDRRIEPFVSGARAWKQKQRCASAGMRGTSCVPTDGKSEEQAFCLCRFGSTTREGRSVRGPEAAAANDIGKR